jgi:hypothetical protein
MHTLAWASIETCALYVLNAGFAGRREKRVDIAGADLETASRKNWARVWSADVRICSDARPHPIAPRG